MNQTFAVNICNKIAGLIAPRVGAEDFPIWKHSTDDYFSIKSVYMAMYKEIERESPPSFPFKLIWKLKCPPRVNNFIWRIAHGRLMTNEFRFERNFSDSDLCPRCLQQPESIMHILRHCESWRNLLSLNSGPLLRA